MEENVIQPSGTTPGLHVSGAGLYHVKGIATWMKVMAVLCTIMMVFIIYLAIKLIQLTPVAGIPYLIVAAIYAYPLVKAYTVSSHFKRALNSDDSAEFESGLSDMRSMLVYIGVLAIIGMVFTVLGVITIIASGADFFDIIASGMR